ncbi:hypothetical protein ACFFNY_27375 [Paenibacillus hodogayensis]|uniref:Lipoprotein n=1 Tax=Paenibacillus hodogayensis TaxID=279208 RepID=A0ABV5W416_9BACL
MRKRWLAACCAMVLLLTGCEEDGAAKPRFADEEIRNVISALKKTRQKEIDRAALRSSLDKQNITEPLAPMSGEQSGEAYTVKVGSQTYEFRIVPDQEELKRQMEQLRFNGLIRSCIDCTPIYENVKNMLVVQDPLHR